MDWQIASQGEDALKVLLSGSSPVAVAEVAADLQLSSAMVYRLLAVYPRDPSTSSLLPNRGGRVSGTRLLNTDVESLILKLISCYYLKRQRPRVADLHREIILECRRAKLAPPSYKAVWAPVNAVDPALILRKREGAGVARDRFSPVKKGLAPKRPKASALVKLNLFALFTSTGFKVLLVQDGPPYARDHGCLPQAAHNRQQFKTLADAFTSRTTLKDREIAQQVASQTGVL